MRFLHEKVKYLGHIVRTGTFDIDQGESTYNFGEETINAYGR